MLPNAKLLEDGREEGAEPNEGDGVEEQLSDGKLGETKGLDDGDAVEEEWAIDGDPLAVINGLNVGTTVAIPLSKGEPLGDAINGLFDGEMLLSMGTADADGVYEGEVLNMLTTIEAEGLKEGEIL